MNRSWMWKQRSYREQFHAGEGGSGAGGAAVAADDQNDGQQAADEMSDAEQDDSQVDQQAEDDGEVVITLGDEVPPAASEDEIEGKPAPAWVKELRKEAKEAKKRIRELEAERTAQQAAAAPKAEDVGPEPQPEDFDYDAKAYAKATLAWEKRKEAADAKLKAEQQEQEAAAAEWNGQLDAYRKAGASLKGVSFDDAQDTVRGVLNPVQQAILVQAPATAQLSAQLVVALGNSPAELKKLADIKNNVKFTVAVTELVGKLKVQPKKAPPPAERVVRGSAGGATSVDSTRDRLEAEADRTGDRSKVIAYDRDKRRKQAA